MLAQRPVVVVREPAPEPDGLDPVLLAITVGVGGVLVGAFAAMMIAR